MSSEVNIDYPTTSIFDQLSARELSVLYPLGGSGRWVQETGRYQLLSTGGTGLDDTNEDKVL